VKVKNQLQFYFLNDIEVKLKNDVSISLYNHIFPPTPKSVHYQVNRSQLSLLNKLIIYEKNVTPPLNLEAATTYRDIEKMDKRLRIA
jgi:hypothetical protein